MQLPRLRPRKVVRTSLILSMWHQWFNPNFMKLLEYFLCAKKTKIMTLLNQFLLLSVFDVYSGQYHRHVLSSACKQNAACVFYIRTLAPVSVAPHTCIMVVSETLPSSWTRIKKLFLEVIFVFFPHTKCSCTFMTFRLNHWCHMDYFNNVLTTFLGLESGSCVSVWAGSESSRIS